MLQIAPVLNNAPTSVDKIRRQIWPRARRRPPPEGYVIEAVAAAAHGLRDAVPLQHRAIRLGGVLHAAITVVDQPTWRAMPLDGHDQGADAQLGLRWSAMDQPTISRVAMSLIAAR